MSGTNVVDLVAKQVLSQIESQIEPRVTAAATAAAEEARAAAEQQITQWLGDGGQIVIATGAEGTADARDRAVRTIIQGAVSTVVVAVLLAVASVIGGNGFDWTNAADWKAVGGAAIGAVLTAVTAYVHRLVKPPAGQG
ncbi:hypothetical protein D5S18_22155 [Nocardia panacis]|uniref:Uncharacterized protein n=1 Tax=Nocardia panacis TaxID=2340916 RepID=A0A3A4K442_9NOCA|nr:hypothetical protein [Nocardia panacis]RJO72980.1 hypothetical protein D5S18_22155 [Nocardia panacis]